LSVVVCAVLGLCIVAPSPVTAAGPAGVMDLDQLHGSAKLDALVDLVVERQRNLTSLRADFVQVKRSSMLLDAVTSTGEFCYLAPNRVRWDYDQPDPMVVLFSDEFVTTYHPTRQRAERVKVSSRDRRFVQALAGTLPLDDLMDYFKLTLSDKGAPWPYLFDLEPTAASLKRKLDSLHIEVDRSLLLPVVVEFREADGDSTRYEFLDMEIDPELEASQFRLKLGDDVDMETIDASNDLS
jgi:outer membrane lipoprotein-sorting protein